MESALPFFVTLRVTARFACTLTGIGPMESALPSFVTLRVTARFACTSFPTAAERRLRYRNRVLNVQTIGEGARSVVMLHGFLGSGRNLGSLARKLARSKSDLLLHCLDLPGHGRSPPLSDEASLQTMAEQVMATILPWTPCDILGHSLGGRVALQIKLLAPDLCKQIILLDISPGAIARSDTDQVIDALRSTPKVAKNRDDMRQSLEGMGLSPALSAWLLMNGEVIEEGFRWRIDRERLAKFHQGSRFVELWDAIDADVSQIYGAESSYLGQEDLDRLEQAGVPCVRIESAGHFLHAEKTDEVAKAILTVLVPDTDP